MPSVAADIIAEEAVVVLEEVAAAQVAGEATEAVLAAEVQVGAGKKPWALKVLNSEQRTDLEARIHKLEDETGAEIIVAILKSADNYLHAPLMIAAFFTFLTTLMLSTLMSFSHEYLLIVIQIPLFMLFFSLGKIPFFKMQAVSDAKKTEEFNEKAQALFLELGVNQTKERVGSLLVVSLFERKIRLLVDEKLAKEISQKELDQFVQTLIPHFKNSEFYLGLSESLVLIEKKYRELFPQKLDRKSSDELPDTIRWFDYS